MIEYILDKSPTFYLLGLGIVMRWIGSYIHQRYPRVAFFQFACSIVVFALYGARRLVVEPPQDIVEIIEAFIRGGSFAMIAFGILGGISTMYFLALDYKDATEAKIRQRRDRFDAEQRAEREAQERRQRLANQPSPEQRARERAEAEQKRREREAAQAEEQKRQEAEFQRKQTLRMQCELDAQYVADANQRKSIRQFIASYLDDGLTESEFESRLEIIRGFIADQIQKSTPEHRFNSLPEIDEYFTKRREEIDSMEQTEIEKASLRAFTEIEKQNAIREFLQQEVGQ